jgi:hypothetical protein
MPTFLPITIVRAETSSPSWRPDLPKPLILVSKMKNPVATMANYFKQYQKGTIKNSQGKINNLAKEDLW